MKKYFLFVLFSFILIGALFPKSKSSEKNVFDSPYEITASFFYEVQSSLGNPLQSGFSKIGMDSSKLLLISLGAPVESLSMLQVPFIGHFEKSTVKKRNVDIREIHVLGNSGSLVEDVYFIFTSNDKSELERLKNEFEDEGDKLYGAKDMNIGGCGWERGKINSFLVTNGLSGSYCYTVCFSLNAMY